MQQQDRSRALIKGQYFNRRLGARALHCMRVCYSVELFPSFPHLRMWDKPQLNKLDIYKAMGVVPRTASISARSLSFRARSSSNSCSPGGLDRRRVPLVQKYKRRPSARLENRTQSRECSLYGGDSNHGQCCAPFDRMSCIGSRVHGVIL